MLHSEIDTLALAVPLPVLALAVQHTSVVGAGVGIAGAEENHAMRLVSKAIKDIRSKMDESVAWATHRLRKGRNIACDGCNQSVQWPNAVYRRGQSFNRVCVSCKKKAQGAK